MKIQDLPGLQGDFKASLGNLSRLHLKVQSVPRAREELSGAILAGHVQGSGFNPSTTKERRKETGDTGTGVEATRCTGSHCNLGTWEAKRTLSAKAA